jgi:hypothetical protein
MTARSSIMIEDIPDPFGPPEDMISMMKSLAQLHSAAILSGLPEPTATKFIADVFIGFSMMNAQGAPEPPEDAVG